MGQDIRVRGTKVPGHAVDLLEPRAIGLNMADNQLSYKDEISGMELPLLGVVMYREEMMMSSETYALRNDTIYKCKINGNPEPWNPDHWDALPLQSTTFTKVEIISGYAKINGSIQERFKVGEALALDEAMTLGHAQRLFLSHTDVASDSALLNGMPASYYAIKTHDHGTDYLGLYAKAQDSYDSDTIQGLGPDTFALANGDATKKFSALDTDMQVASKDVVNVDTIVAYLGQFVKASSLGSYANINGDANNVFHVKEDVSVTSALNATRADQLYIKVGDFPTVPNDPTLWLNGMGSWMPNPSNVRWLVVQDANPVIPVNTKSLIDSTAGVMNISLDGTGAIEGDMIELAVIEAMGDINITSTMPIDGQAYSTVVTDGQFFLSLVYTTGGWVTAQLNTEQVDDIELEDVLYTADMLMALKDNHCYIVPSSVVTTPNGVDVVQANLGSVFGITDLAVDSAQLVKVAGDNYLLYLSNGSVRTLTIEDNGTPVVFKSLTYDNDLIIGDQAIINGTVTASLAKLNQHLLEINKSDVVTTTVKTVMRIVTNGEEFSFLWDHTLWAPTNPYDNTANDINNPQYTVGWFATSFTDYTGADVINDKALGYAQITAGVYVPIIDHHGYHLTGASIKAMIANGIGVKFKYDNTKVIIDEVFTVGATPIATVDKSHLSPAILYGHTNIQDITGTLTQVMQYTGKYDGHSDMTINQPSGVITVAEDALYEIVADAEIILAGAINPGDEKKAIVIEVAATPPSGTTLKADIVDINTVEKDTLIYKKMGTHMVHLTAGMQVGLAVMYTGADIAVTTVNINFKMTKLD